MPQAFVKIVNRNNGYTNQRKAISYVQRRLAAVVASTDTGLILEIRMLETAELAVLRSSNKSRRRAIDQVTGKFEWFVGDSGGSQLMLEYEGISGGSRVYKAVHAN